MVVYIYPHERDEAIIAYQGWLSGPQICEIEDAPETAIVMLRRINGETEVQIILEG